MTRYILGRLAILPFSLIIVSLLAFTFIHLVPGDAVDALGGENMTIAESTHLRDELGLDKPIIVQFAYWMASTAKGNLGTSILNGRPVSSEVMSRLGVTIELACFAVVISLVGGVVAGGIATRWRGTWVDRLIMLLSTIGMSTPNFFVATILILAISLYLPDFGVVSYVPADQNLLLNLKSLLFPAISLAVVAGSTFCRYVRGTTEDILRTSDFIRTARAKGASEDRILVRHILPNALIPLTTVAGLQLAYLIGGTVVIESIFALPGVGQLLVAAIAQRDYPIVQGCVLLQATSFVVINLIVDLLYPILDPRVKVAGKGR